MISPAQRHKARILGGLAATSTALALARPTSGSEATEYELQRVRLGEDVRRLREIQSIERKIELKRDLLPAYGPWIDGVLAAAAAPDARGVHDDILVQNMIWRIDVGDYAGALPLVEYVLRWSLALPERFNRTAATMVAEEIAEAAFKRLDQGEAFDLELLLTIEDLTADEDMHDQVRAKLCKAIGRELARRADAMEPAADGPAGGRRAAYGSALAKLRRALELNDAAGVKTEIARIEREIRKLNAGAAIDVDAAVDATLATLPTAPPAPQGTTDEA